MMKLLCVREDNKRFGLKILSLGEIYDGEIYSHNIEDYYEISPNKNNDKYILDLGGSWVFSRDLLVPLAEYREQQIESIINGEEN